MLYHCTDGNAEITIQYVNLRRAVKEEEDEARISAMLPRPSYPAKLIFVSNPSSESWVERALEGQRREDLTES
jgi:hypothetical protein